MIIHCIHIVQVEIIEEVTDMLENETNPVTFKCQTTGDPVPIISWYFNGAMINISDASKHTISNSLNGTVVTSSLTIMNAQSSDAGIYTCEAANFINTVRSSGILTINGEHINTYVSQLCLAIVHILSCYRCCRNLGTSRRRN